MKDMAEEIKKEEIKKCSHCQMDIPFKAKKCPHCQSDLRNWLNRHPILTVLGVFIIFIIAISMVGNSMKKEGYVPKTDETAKQNEVKQSPQKETQAMVF